MKDNILFIYLFFNEGLGYLNLVFYNFNFVLYI